MQQKTSMPHSFYIPVMGTGFTIDTPLFVAKYGISSVISLVDDVLIEQMRKFWCEKSGEQYEPINSTQEDARAKRITAYLNLLQKLINKQISAIKNGVFQPNSELTNYFEMLAASNPLKKSYEKMLAEKNSEEKIKLQEKLRDGVVAGRIDVNIMTKVDAVNYSNGQPLPYEFCDAAAALRGYATSNLNSMVVLSAGFNPHLYGYLPKFVDFFPDDNSEIKKKVCLKVSDYRSAAVQGKYLAKRGIWISEYRIESPLNCGGHAFINDGQLLGPILDEFRRRKDELIETLHEIYKNALIGIRKFCTDIPQKVRITVQGGVGTNAEHEFLLKHYELDGAGWGTPFLMVPEVTNVDDVTLQKLMRARPDDVFLSNNSPMGVPFWNLRNSGSEEAREERIKNNKPGSVCVKGYDRFNQEFTKKPVCLASREYQSLKIKSLESSDLPAEKLARLKADVLSKSCICHDLCGGVLIKRNIDLQATPAICPGPNIINFKKIATLKEMVDHIYGRCSLLVSSERPHVFIKELQLQINYLRQEMKDASLGLSARSQQKIMEVKNNLIDGIEYYRTIAQELLQEQQEKFLQMLEELRAEVEQLNFAV